MLKNILGWNIDNSELSLIKITESSDSSRYI